MGLFSKIKRKYKKEKLFNQQFLTFKNKLQQSSRSDFSCDEKDFYPCMEDNTSITGFDAHYLYHPAWAARRIKEVNPLKHIDISSILYFSSLLSAFVPVEFYDYRPASIQLDGLTMGSADLCNLHFNSHSVQSLSCMHTVEHVGLGRYGDPIDADGDLSAMSELARVLAVRGHLYFVTPVGKPKVCFNAHRIYSYEQILSYFPSLSLVEFSLIPDDGLERGMIQNADPKLVDMQNYGCGCFIFTKNKT